MRIPSQETKEKIANTVKRRWADGSYKSRVNGATGKPAWNKGQTWSDEIRAKMSASAKMRHRREGNIEGGRSKVHRRIWNENNPHDKIVKGDGYIIHHKDENHDNNEPSNLQKVTLAETI